MILKKTHAPADEQVRCLAACDVTIVVVDGADLTGVFQPLALKHFHWLKISQLLAAHLAEQLTRLHLCRLPADLVGDFPFLKTFFSHVRLPRLLQAPVLHDKKFLVQFY